MSAYPMCYKDAPELKAYMLKNVTKTNKILGSGSFGTVEEFAMHGSLCAGKQLHDTLLDPQNRGVERLVEKFVEECRLMTAVRHPNIVQFFGLCLNPNSKHPLLVMERLAMSLDDLLIKTDADSGMTVAIPISLKISILSDTVKGLDYLHSHNPPIIHRDLTSKNVLLTSSMQGKIADLGNSLIIGPQEMASTMTQTPGTSVYMPPEATSTHSRYDSKLDMFSYGHLALYTMIQKFPVNLSAATYTDKSNKLQARSELERRSEYLKDLDYVLGHGYLISQIIKKCLQNAPHLRPSSSEVMQQLKSCTQQDEYEEFSSMTKLELFQRLKQTRSPSGPHQQANQSTDQQSVQLIQKIKSGMPCQLNLTKSVNTGTFKSRRTITKKPYMFQIQESSKLVYYEEPKVKAEIKLSDVASVKRNSGTSQQQYPFELRIAGKEGYWLITAQSEDERTSWMEALMPGSFMKNNPAPEPPARSPNQKHNKKDNDEEGTYIRPDESNNYLTLLPSTEIGLSKDDKTELIHTTQKEEASPSHAVKPKPEESTIVNNDQLNIFMSMLQAIATQGFNQVQTGSGNQTSSTRAMTDQAGEGSVPPPLPPKPKVNGEKQTATDRVKHKFQSRPTNLNFNSKHLYTNTTVEPEQPQATDGESITCNIPDLIVEEKVNDNDIGINLSQEGFLKPDTVRHKLVRVLSENDGSSLLMTDESDNVDVLNVVPEWARASGLTAATPVLSPMNSGSLTLMKNQALYLEQSSLSQLEEIGEGHFGKVYKAQLNRKGKQSVTVAIKTVKKFESSEDNRNFLQEMDVMSTMVHPNIIHLYGIVSKDSPWVVLEYFVNSDLKDYLVKNQRQVDQLIKYMIDIAMGMHYLAEKGLVHRDLAARNVMVSDNETCKVADFGMLREIPKDDQIYHAKTNLPFPIRWMAPESLEKKEYSCASDVWSFAILLWEMYHPNKVPYEELDNMQCATRIVQGYLPAIPESYPTVLKHIMKACWQRKTEKRPSFLLITTILTNLIFQNAA